MGAWVLVFLLNCPGQPGFCQVDYLAEESRDECVHDMAALKLLAYSGGRFTRAECYHDPAWPAGELVRSESLRPQQPPPRRK